MSKTATGKIINVLGVELMTFENTNQIDISAINNGLYFLVLTDGTRVSFIKE